MFEAEFTRRYGNAGSSLFHAYTEVSDTPLMFATFFDFRWDFTLYSEGLLALQGEVTKYIGIDALINQPTLDSLQHSIKDYVDHQVRGLPIVSATPMSPITVANLLELRANRALAQVRGIDTGSNVALMYEVADVKAWANIALHLAEKIRGGVDLQFYRVAGGEEHKQAAIAHLTRALAHWDELIRITRPIYKDMPLTHYNGNSFDANPDNLFHWARIRPEVAADIEVARAATRNSP